MEKVRHRYRAEDFQPILSTNPGLHGIGTVGAALIFGTRVARQMFGPKAKCIDTKEIRFHKGVATHICILAMPLGKHPATRQLVYQYLQTYEIDITIERCT